MQTLVLDSSVIVKWLNQINEDNIDKADQILEDARNGSVEIIVPELVKYEVGNVLLKGKQLEAVAANRAIKALHSLPITFITESEDLAKYTFSLASKHQITYYDASFLSLAKKYNARLVTENIKHQGKSNDITVTALKDY